ncbi:GNAT family N-acetyltransferase [Streptomyces sp. NPDC088147]|uniref:GNAT family N-acetyltransferase n=1 Tax=Streptomyces sp. NPDC088147 TaxID=3365830 RepID=UPI0038115568
MNVRATSFDHPDAVKLNDRVQGEYAERYGDEGDATPLAPGMFEPPRGLYLIAYDDRGAPVATGGWRTQEKNEDGYADGDAEIKRMYVTPEVRGHGLARRILAALEDDARAAGRTRMVLETGTKQPEAISLYLSSGYEPCAKFGHYRFHELSRCYAKSLVDATGERTPAAVPAGAVGAVGAVGTDGHYRQTT